MFKKINPYEAQGNAFDMIGKQKMLIVAGDGTKVNGMTASWGALGVIWGAPAAYAFVRDSRYTKEFLDGSETFSLCADLRTILKKTQSLRAKSVTKGLRSCPI